MHAGLVRSICTHRIGQRVSIIMDPDLLLVLSEMRQSVESVYVKN